MDNFNKIIKQKVEQFKVPYNEAHWAEMEGKLNAIRVAKIKKTIFGSAALIAIVAISSYFMLPNNKTSNNNVIVANDNTTTSIVNENNITTVKEKNNSYKKNTIQKDAVINNNTTKEKEIIPEKAKNEELIPNTTSLTSVDENNSIPEKINTNTPYVNAEFIVYNNKVCLGEEVSFESMENDQPVSYTWNFGDGTISHETNPKHKYNDSHIYTVSLTLLNRQTGKEFTSIQQDVVTILVSPATDFSYTELSINHNDNRLKYPYTTFKVKNSTKQNSYHWDFGNKEISTSQLGKTIYEKSGNYTANLTIKGSNGCVSSVTKTINIKNGAYLYVENAFSPNGDNDNETFIPKALLNWDVQFEMTIIDKAGKLVYKTSDKNEPWNGKLYNTGKLMDVGVYLWQVITYDAEGIPHRHSGNINIVK